MAAKAEIVELLNSSRSEVADLVGAIFTASGATTIDQAQSWVVAQKRAAELMKAQKTSEIVLSAIARRKIKRDQREQFEKLGAKIGNDELATILDGLDTSVGQTISEMVNGASRAGKVPPAYRTIWEEAGQALGPEWLESAMAMLPTMVDMGMTDELRSLQGRPGDPGCIPLDEELRELCKRVGLTPEDVRLAQRDGHL